MIKPTIGCPVLFTPGQNSSILHSNQPLAALVTYVWTDRLVNLVVFDEDGGSHGRTSVRLLQDDDAVPENGCFCQWAVEFADSPGKLYYKSRVEPTTAGEAPDTLICQGGAVTTRMGVDADAVPSEPTSDAA
jgi:hypothetical protein